jgi:hypothetical protein
MSQKVLVALALGALLFTGRALADCDGGVDDKQRIYEQALTLERAGDKEAALRAFRAAQGYACGPENPYEADAARRAAPLGQELGAAAEKQGELRRAFELYDAGGHYATADRVFMELTRAERDEPAAYQRALEHYRNRAEASFQSNNAAALRVTGAYTPDPKYMAEVQAMPAQGVERALERERAAFNEQQLREYVALMQSRPEDVLNAESVARWTSEMTAFEKKWQGTDPAAASRRALQELRMWGLNGNDDDLRASVEKRWALLVEQRATTLRTAFHRAPKLLEDAMDYYRVLGADHPGLEGKLTAIRSQARQLGEQAEGQRRYALAADYYRVAGDDAKADAARSMQQQAAMTAMQPSIDAAREQADALLQRFGDPAAVEALRQQAEAARRNLAQQAPSAQSSKESAEELERALGL